ncbi:MAG: hypothetical protein AB7V42_11100 [Thermoleophilia bacterium]
MSGRPRCGTPGRRTTERQATVGGPPWPLPVSLLATAAVAQIAGASALVVAAPDLARGVYYGPAQLGAVHLVGVAFLTVAIVAALLQLVPVLLRTPVGRPVRTGIAAGALAAGSWGLAIGLWLARDGLIATGGTLLVLGGAVIVGDLTAALARAGRAGTLSASGAGLAASTVWLALVLGLGGLMAANRIDPFLEVDRLRLMAAHAAIAIVGWIGGTIIAIALRLAPMFALSHGYRRGPGVVALVLWHASVAPIAIGLGLGRPELAAAGGALLLGACLAACWFVVDVARHRRRRPEAPLVHLGLGLTAAGSAVALMLTAWAGPGDPRRAAIPATILAVVGLGAGVTSGHMFKVVPMLVWTGRYAHLAGTPGAPRLSDLYPAPLAAVEAAAFAAGLALLTGGVAAGAPLVARAGALLLVVAAAAVASAVAVVVLRRRGGPPLTAPATSPFRPLTGGMT